MSRLKSLMTRFAHDDSGAALAEYAVTFLVVALAGVVGLSLIGTNLAAAFEAIGQFVETNITNVVAGAGG